MITSGLISGPHRRYRGFTLIEVLIVMTLVGIMSAFAIPHFRISELAEVQIAGMQMVQDVDFARTRALASRSLARVQFDDNSSPSYSGYLDTDGDSTIAGTNDELQYLHGWGTRPLPDRVLYGRGAIPPVPNDASNSAITFTNSRVEFNSRGIVQPMGTDGVVYLRHANKPECVVAVEVSPAGNVRLWSYKDGSWK
jgi:prepilin-type N-terminal cleavage/methylation domain-containing protein